MLSDKTIKSIWDSMPPTAHDMPYETFKREMRDLTDKGKMQSDLTAIQLMKKTKTIIDRRLKNGN